MLFEQRGYPIRGRDFINGFHAWLSHLAFVLILSTRLKTCQQVPIRLGIGFSKDNPVGPPYGLGLKAVFQSPCVLALMFTVHQHDLLEVTNIPFLVGAIP